MVLQRLAEFALSDGSYLLVAFSTEGGFGLKSYARSPISAQEAFFPYAEKS